MHARLWWLAALAIGAAVRVPALGQDLWLDEIWSIDRASELSSPLDAFFISFDNNHLLTTLYMFALGAAAPAELYRLPSLVAGLLCIAFAFRIGVRSAPEAASPAAAQRAGSTTALVCALAYPLVVYSVEARGYAVAVFAAIAIYARFLKRGLPSFGETFAFWALALLGLLAHFSFVHFLGAFGLWSVARIARLEPSRLRALGLLARLHAVPALALAGLYAILLRDLRIGGGPSWSFGGTLAESFGWALGLPAALGLAPLCALALLVLLHDARARYREGDDSWVLSLGAVVILPLATTFVLEPTFLVPRHFLLAIVFLALALARTLGRALASPRTGVMLAGALGLVVYAGGNALELVPFLRDGRGHYTDALRYIAAHSDARVLTIGSDHDMRNVRVLRHHARVLPPGRAIEYVPRADRTTDPPAWLILHGFDQPPKPAPEVTLRAGRYALHASFPFYGPAGFHWFVYALQKAPS